MTAPAEEVPRVPLCGNPLNETVSWIENFKTLVATSAITSGIATISPVVSIGIGLVLLSRGKVEKDADANELVGTLKTILMKLVLPRGSTNWRHMDYAKVPAYDYTNVSLHTQTYPLDDRGSVSVDGCPKIFKGDLNDLTMGYVFSVGKILQVTLRAPLPPHAVCICVRLRVCVGVSVAYACACALTPPT